MGGKQVPCLRVRIPPAKQAAAAKPAPKPPAPKDELVEILDPEPDQPEFDDSVDF
jgi:hypothetical protein